MEALLATFLVVFLAEMGDKTQFIVMAFAAKYDWRQVFFGMSFGILVVHSLSVLVGTLLGEYIPVHTMSILASLIFVAFGIWTLRGADDEEEEEVHDSRYGPLLTVAMTFIVGEMGDKTQFAALTMAAQYNSWVMVLTGAVLGMIVADSFGILVGIFLNRRLPAKRMRYLSAAIFLLFCIVGLWQCLF